MQNGGKDDSDILSLLHRDFPTSPTIKQNVNAGLRSGFDHFLHGGHILAMRHLSITAQRLHGAREDEADAKR